MMALQGLVRRLVSRGARPHRRPGTGGTAGRQPRQDAMIGRQVRKFLKR